jgi:hypothetical protein
VLVENLDQALEAKHLVLTFLKIQVHRADLQADLQADLYQVVVGDLALYYRNLA